MYASDFFEKGVLNTFLGTTFDAPATLWAALFLNNPTDTGTAGTELTYEGYERVPITFRVPAPESGGIGIKNDNESTFPKSPTDSGAATYVGIFDSKTGGNMYLYGELVDPLAIKAGESPVLLIDETLFFSTGSFSISFKSKMFNVLRGTSLQGFQPHLALFNGEPENGGSEIISVGTNYARQVITFSNPADVVGGQSAIASTANISYQRSTTDWGNYDYLAIMLSNTSNECALFEKKSVKQILKGRMVHITSGEIRVAIN